MKIPKYINEALRMRTKTAQRFLNYDFIVSRWILDNKIDEYLETEDFCGGVESIMNPQDSEDRIREAILKR